MLALVKDACFQRRALTRSLNKIYRGVSRTGRHAQTYPFLHLCIHNELFAVKLQLGRDNVHVNSKGRAAFQQLLGKTQHVALVAPDVMHSIELCGGGCVGVSRPSDPATLETTHAIYISRGCESHL